MQNILFIGGAGFIGSNIINMITDKTMKIFVMEPPHVNISRITNINVNHIQGTLCDYNHIEEIIKKNNINIIIHLVSTLLPSSGYKDYENELNNVIYPTIRLIKYCSENRIKFVYFSSGGTIYGNRNELRPFTEENELNPISYYGLSKQTIENYINYFHRFENLEYLILRPSNPYGKGQNIYGKQGLIAVSLGKILSHQPIQIYGNGESIRDYIYIDDLSKIFISLLERNISNETFNIGTCKGYSINNIISTLKKIVNENIIIEYVPTRKEDVSNVILDNQKLLNILDFNFTTLEDGIMKTYNHVKNNQTNGEY